MEPSSNGTNNIQSIIQINNKMKNIAIIAIAFLMSFGQAFAQNKKVNSKKKRSERINQAIEYMKSTNADDTSKDLLINHLLLLESKQKETAQEIEVFWASRAQKLKNLFKS